MYTERILVSVDTGRSGGKTIDHEMKTAFVPSRFKKGKMRKLIGKLTDYAPSDIDFKYYGKDGQINEEPEHWFIGELAQKESDISTSVWSQSKADPKTLYLILASLYRAGYHSGRFTVVTLIPYSTFDDEEIEALKKLVEGNHSLEINGVAFNYNIEELLLMPETISAYYGLPVEWTEGKYVYIVDVGARTMTLAAIDPSGELIEARTETVPVGLETEKFDDDYELVEFIVDKMNQLNWDEPARKGVLVPIGGNYKSIGKVLCEIQPDQQSQGKLINEIGILQASDLGLYEPKRRDDAGRFANALGAYMVAKEALVTEEV
ncbi:hypothetical protein SAMN04487866_12212 [Thermoactinomyces sp. DSM 45891]|uniref:ParM/StbA family protein n=1 Tax=Thermoactinomyces sp. DSM 45891 TaxID=1761907 RepID=UPI00091D5B02|nr:hypothetical protein [Thermoactinomyces sp. DSM 45891]SFX74692.1 hypothetical protein SAMN04487866_12212 [Thermoactinomyces sp. DSM 45891]